MSRNNVSTKLIRRVSFITFNIFLSLNTGSAICMVNRQLLYPRRHVLWKKYTLFVRCKEGIIRIFTNLSRLGVYYFRLQIFVANEKPNGHCGKQSGVVSPFLHFTVTMPRIVRTCNTTKLPGRRRRTTWQPHYTRHV